jgi:formylglycine-generating enzyme required for sulfatase activity
MSSTSRATAAPPGMVLVPGGTFLYGSEKRAVEVPSFFIDILPVTNKEWELFNANAGLAPPRHWPEGRVTKELEDCPVVWVTFEEAEQYAKSVGKELPTPQQWEKAARGTDGRKYPWGGDFDPKRVNSKEAGVGKPVPAATLKRSTSPFGCLGMGGNVLDWTTGIADKKKGSRVIKGGSFRHYLGAISWQYDADPKKGQDAVGLRCVKLVTGEAK